MLAQVVVVVERRARLVWIQRSNSNHLPVLPVVHPACQPTGNARHNSAMQIGIRIGLSSPSPATVADYVEQIVAAERDGFDIAWLPQILGFDSLTMIAMAGMRTSKIVVVT